MSNGANTHIEQFNSVIEECENYCGITRDSGLQKDACDKLNALLGDCDRLKSKAVAAGDEDTANLLLGFECVAHCLLSEMKMWLLLKAEQPDAAWDELISAQMAADAAARAHKGFEHLVRQGERLEQIEKLVFPPQVFVSAGLIVRRQECSICGSEYGECDHLAGKPYWGQFCYIVARDIEGNHVAIVENPADKRCRVTGLSVDGGERNRMTWKVTPAQGEKGNDSPQTTDIGSAGKSVPAKSLHATARLLYSRA